MKIYTSDTCIFYNQDCSKWGVKQIVKGITLHCQDGITRQLYKWQQVAIGEKTYTPYKKVADRWANSVRDNSITEIIADMEEEY